MYLITRLHCKKSYFVTVSANLCGWPKIRQMTLRHLTKRDLSQLGLHYKSMSKIQNSYDGVLYYKFL